VQNVLDHGDGRFRIVAAHGENVQTVGGLLRGEIRLAAHLQRFRAQGVECITGPVDVVLDLLRREAEGCRDLRHGRIKLLRRLDALFAERDEAGRCRRQRRSRSRSDSRETLSRKTANVA